jgi:hypothetical protein
MVLRGDEAAPTIVGNTSVAGSRAESSVPDAMLLASSAVRLAPEPLNVVAAQVPVIVTFAPNVDAPAVTVSPPAVIVAPPAVTISPPAVTVSPVPTVTVAAKLCAFVNVGAVENVHAPVIVAAASTKAAYVFTVVRIVEKFAFTSALFACVFAVKLVKAAIVGIGAPYGLFGFPS